MKTILVTGASGDIGSTIVAKLSAEGHMIHAAIHDPSKASRIESIPNITIHRLDVTSREEIFALAQQIPEPVDWLVAAHGYIDTTMDIADQKPEDIKAIFNINSISLAYLTQAFLKKTSGFIFISSTAGVAANGRHAVYSMSKAAVNSLAQAMGRNKPEKVFISVCPGPTKGAIVAKLGRPDSGQDPAHVAQLAADIIAHAPSEEYRSGDIIVVRDGIRKLESRLS